MQLTRKQGLEAHYKILNTIFQPRALFYNIPAANQKGDYCGKNGLYRGKKDKFTA